MKSLSLRWRIVLGFILASLIPSAIILSGYLYWIQSTIENRVIGNLMHLADKKNQQLTALFNARLQDIRVLAHHHLTAETLTSMGQVYRSSGPQSAAYVAQEQIFKERVYNYIREKGFYDVLLIDNDGEVVYSLLHEADFATNLHAPANRDSILAAVFRKAQATLTEQISDFQPYGPSRNRAAFFVAAPVMNNEGARIGVLAMQIDYAAIHDIIQDFAGLGKSGETAIAQKIGQEIVYLTPLRHRLDAAFKLRMPIPATPSDLAMSLAFGIKSGENSARDYRGIEVVAVTRYIPLMNWGMVVKMDAAEAFAEAGRFHLWAGFFRFLALAVFIFSGLLISRSIISPIRDLILFSEKIASGMFEERIKVALNDEVGALGHAFNSMADELQSFYEDLEQKIVERTKRLSGILETAAEAIISVNGQGEITHFNQGAERIFGYKASETLGHPVEILLPEGMRERHRGHFLAFMAGPAKTRLMSERSEIRGRRKDGGEFPAEASISKFYIGDEVTLNIMLIDITERKRSEQTIQFQATHDLLTGLPNRILFLDRMEQAMETARRSHHQFAVLFIDLDGFKAINDSFGHQAGDFVLEKTAERISNCLRDTDTVARIGGDEFTIIVEDVDTPDAVAAICEKILETVAEPIADANRQYNISCSIGVALYPNGVENRDTLIQQADDAMYEAKEAGKNLYRFFTRSIQDKANRSQEIVHGIKRALREDRIEVFYQPIVDLQSGAVSSAEALMRWRNDEGEYVSPNIFIPIAENHGLIGDIGCRVLEIACRDALSWPQVSPSPVRLSVNKSPRQFLRDSECQEWFDILQQHAFPLNLLTLEITENLMLTDEETYLPLLRKFRDLGIKIALDDFGTGYSSLNYIRTIPLDILKIDRSFVGDIGEIGKSRSLIETIIAMAHSNGLTVVAEGIETQQQRDFLNWAGCEFGQGYAIAKPLSSKQFLSFLRAGNGE